MNVNRAILLLSLLVLAAPLFALTGADAAKAFKEPSDTLTTTKMAVPSGTYLLVTLNGGDALVLKDSDGSVVSDESTIRKILTDNIFALADLQTRQARIHESILAFNASRQPEENKCKQWLGLLNPGMECVSKETCQRSCLSSPTCSEGGPMAATGFLPAVQAWVVLINKLDTAVTDFRGTQDSVSQGGSAIDAQINKLNAVKSAMNDINNNGVVMNLSKTCDTCFGFCKKSVFSTASLDSISSDLSALKTALGPLDLVSSKASSIKAASDRETAYQASKKSKYLALSDKAANRKAELVGNANTLLAKVDSKPISDSAAKLENITGDILYLGNKGDYRLALAKEAAFDSQATDLDALVKSVDYKYKALLTARKNLTQNLNAAYAAVGIASSATAELDKVKAKAENVDKRLKGQISESDISLIDDELDALSDEVKDILAAAALSGATNKGGTTPVIPTDVSKQIPPEAKKYCCGLGAILGVVLVASFAGRRKE